MSAVDNKGNQSGRLWRRARMSEDDRRITGGLWRSVRKWWATLSLPLKIAVVLGGLSYVGVLAVGLSNQQPMVADEIVHYYLVENQGRQLPVPTVTARIPMQGWVYEREYPHVFLWHYTGAVVWRFLGPCFGVVQVYHTLFWLQLLVVGWCLLRHEFPSHDWAVLLGMTCLASMPMGLLFSVLLFQGIPATAQVLTAFYLLRKGRCWWSVLFLGISLSIKVTAFIFVPLFLLVMLGQYARARGIIKAGLRCVLATLLLAMTCVPMGLALRQMHWNYYPLSMVQQYTGRAIKWGRRPPPAAPKQKARLVTPAAPAVVVKPPRPEIANHPGDLRTPSNWLTYGGGVMWAVIGLGVAGALALLLRRETLKGLPWWMLIPGVGYLALTGWHMKTAPDARFFVSGLPFIMFLAAGLTARLPGARGAISGLVVLAMLQAALVLGKVHQLRHIPAPIHEMIEEVSRLPEAGRGYFMYPEGHELFMPGAVQWDLGYRLREFWRADNDRRRKMLRDANVNLVIIKKRRIKDVGADTHDLGVYPLSFVRDIRGDPKFEKVFENELTEVYRVHQD